MAAPAPSPASAPDFRKVLLTPQRYIQAQVECSESERVNGFQLYDVKKGSNVMPWEMFREWCELADNEVPGKWTRTKFADEMYKECCSDWYKQDIHGECYGGPWAQPEGSYAHTNAYTLCMKQAVSAMWKLPFSKDVLLRTIDEGCGNRMESVRYSNFLCVWMERKRKAMTQ